MQPKAKLEKPLEHNAAIASNIVNFNSKLVDLKK